MRYKNYINESSLSRIITHIKDTTRSFGVISPYRQSNSDKENAQAYKELAKTVRGMGYGFIPLKGGYIEETGFVDEKSLFIPNISRKDIIELGKKYDQHSVIHKDPNEFTMIGANKNAGIGKTLVKFSVSNITVDDIGNIFTDFFSKLVKGSHAGKKFRFLEHIETGSSFNGSRSKWMNIFTEEIL